MHFTEDLEQRQSNPNTVHFEQSKSGEHTLWQPNEQHPKPEPLFHLRVCVYHKQDGEPKFPSRNFAFKSHDHITQATHQLITELGEEYNLEKCGTETDATNCNMRAGMEHIKIRFDDESASVGWKEFLEKLRRLEDQWELQGMNLL